MVEPSLNLNFFLHPFYLKITQSVLFISFYSPQNTSLFMFAFTYLSLRAASHGLAYDIVVNKLLILFHNYRFSYLI